MGWDDEYLVSYNVDGNNITCTVQNFRLIIFNKLLGAICK